MQFTCTIAVDELEDVFELLGLDCDVTDSYDETIADDLRSGRDETHTVDITVPNWTVEELKDHVDIALSEGIIAPKSFMFSSYSEDRYNLSDVVVTICSVDSKE